MHIRRGASPKAILAEKKKRDADNLKLIIRELIKNKIIK